MGLSEAEAYAKKGGGGEPKTTTKKPKQEIKV